MGALRHTQHTRARVLAKFAECGRIDLSTAACGVERTAHYAWLKKYPDYAAAFEEARQQAADLLEAEAWRRAREGTAKPVFHAGKRAEDIVIDDQGNPVLDADGKPKLGPAFVREYSDNVLMFLLKGRRREVYGDKLEQTGKDGAPLFDLPTIRAYMNSEPDDQE